MSGNSSTHVWVPDSTHPRKGTWVRATGTSDGAVGVSASSLSALTGGQSASVSISGTSAASAAITAGSAVVTPTVDCFFRQGAATPTALANGTDQLLLGGNTYRISNITSGNLLAFITTGATGTVYITPGA